MQDFCLLELSTPRSSTYAQAEQLSHTSPMISGLFALPSDAAKALSDKREKSWTPFIAGWGVPITTDRPTVISACANVAFKSRRASGSAAENGSAETADADALIRSDTTEVCKSENSIGEGIEVVVISILSS